MTRLPKQRMIGIAMAMMALVVRAACAQRLAHFVVDAGQDVHPISRFIYGINQPLGGIWTNLALTRLGGNRWTAYNWVNNASNAGNDWHFQNDDYLGGGNAPGGAVLPALKNAYENNAGVIVTIPINGYVSADKSPGGDVRKSGADYLSKRFAREMASKGAAFSLMPDPNAAIVYQDEFVNWVETRCPYAQTDMTRPIFFMLDNEPDLWAETHAEVHPAPVRYGELVAKSVEYATAIKKVAPDALVFGPASYGWNGFVSLQNAPDAAGRDFLSFYLQQMSAASAKAGRRLIDALDVHWYPEATGNGVRIVEDNSTEPVVAARLQAPRSLWDPDYVETSWITHDSVHGPIHLIPTLMGKIAREFSGTKLSISEYNYGGGEDVSGAIAQADVLGIFARMQVFAACEWPMSGHERFIAGGFSMYRNFDGKGGSFGDTSISATTDAPVDTSIYASIDSAKEMTLVAINKTLEPVTASVELKNATAFGSADIYELTAVSPKPAHKAHFALPGATKFEQTLPPRSVSTIRLHGGV